MGGRGAALILVIGSTLVLAGCESAPPEADVHVLVFLPGHGTGSVTVESLVTRPSNAPGGGFSTFAEAIARGLGVGRVGSVRAENQRAIVSLDDIGSSSVTVDLGSVAETVREFGYDAATTSFVSVCGPARHAEVVASGPDVEVMHFASCALLVNRPTAGTAGTAGTTGSTDTATTVTLSLSDRLPVWLPMLIWVSVLTLGGIAAAFMIGMVLSAERWLLVPVVPATMFFSSLAVLSALGRQSELETYDTGQIFDTATWNGYRLAALVAVAGVVLPPFALPLGAGWRSMRHRRGGVRSPSCAGPP